MHCTRFLCDVPAFSAPTIAISDPNASLALVGWTAFVAREFARVVFYPSSMSVPDCLSDM